jgi:hypothetical protein
MLHSNLAYQVAHTDSYWPYQYLLAIFGSTMPGEPSDRASCARLFGTVSCDHITRNFGSPQGEGFPPSPKGTLKKKRAHLFSTLCTVTFLVSVLSLISFISLYFYKLPTHHCLFCILQKEYGYIGYPLYPALLGATITCMRV